MNKDCFGYISSIPFWFDTYLPQRIQNIIIRDYCKQNELNLIWSSPEVSHGVSITSFQDIILKADDLSFSHIVAISFMMHTPSTWEIISEILIEKKLTMHFAIENISINCNEIDKWNDKLFEINASFIVNKSSGQKLPPLC